MPIKYVYPGNLADKHPVFTRISILKRNNDLAGMIERGITPDSEITGDLKKFVSQTRSQIRTTDTVETGVANIYLYVPASVTINDSLQYDNAEMGIITSAVVSAADEAIKAGATDMGTAFGAAEGAATGLGQALVQEGSKAAGVRQQLKLNQGTARNPRTEMLFKSPGLRQLSLTWKLMPTNRQESDHIFDMIQTIRSHSYPATSGSEVLFSFPDIFQIDFVTKHGGAAQMVKFAKAYCTSITTNYGASGPAFFKDGKPVEIDLTMTFQETQVQTRESIEEGF